MFQLLGRRSASEAERTIESFGKTKKTERVLARIIRLSKNRRPWQAGRQRGNYRYYAKSLPMSTGDLPYPQRTPNFQANGKQLRRYPLPPVFVRVANKGVGEPGFVRVSNKGLREWIVGESAAPGDYPSLQFCKWECHLYVSRRVIVPYW